MSNSYRPLTDTWILARARTGYYGSYPLGFLHRARELLGITARDPMLHVCGGMARKYPYRGFGPNDKTLDADASLNPDFVHDVRNPLPQQDGGVTGYADIMLWPAQLADPPYTKGDAAKYALGESFYPEPGPLLNNCIQSTRIGGRVGLLHYEWPRPPKNAISVAIITVVTGFNQRPRIYSVYERTA